MFLFFIFTGLLAIQKPYTAHVAFINNIAESR